MKKLMKVLLSSMLMLSLTACGSSGSDVEKQELTFESTELFDTDKCKMTVTSMEYDDDFVCNVELENKTSSCEEMFSVDYATINGYKIDPLFATTVAAEAKSNDKITFSSSDLEEAGIVDVTDIKLHIRVYDNDEWTDFHEETYTLYPLGEDKSTTYTRESTDDDQVLIDEQDVKVIATKKDPDGFWGYTVTLYLENNTKKNLMFSADDFNVDGYSFTSMYACSLEAGDKAYTDLYLSSSEMEEAGIEDVTSIKVPFTIYDADTLSDELVNKTVEIK